MSLDKLPDIKVKIEKIDTSKLFDETGHINKVEFHLQVCRMMIQGLGYDFEMDRVERIAIYSHVLMAGAWPFNFAFFEALEVELLLYGDPEADEFDIKPFLRGQWI